ncbi:MAG: hypothetical protein EA360_10875 [Balneolaceae bacterium]|nr:MAG: hypothetical protein EA360_10875 [Balneolaceae bacterium]
MKITIAGRQERCIAWEKHLRKLSAIQEVVITESLNVEERTDAVLLIDDSPSRLDKLLESVKHGFHTYLISRLSDDVEKLERIYHSAEESGVTVQFSHWPSMAESTHMIRKLIEKPDLVQIKKECVPLPVGRTQTDLFDHDWIDELALIIKWLGGNIHRYEVKPVLLEKHLIGLSLTLRFENSAVASVQYFSRSDREIHQRLISSHSLVADCDVIRQRIRILSLNDFDKISSKIHDFDPSDTAEWSVTQFIKSIQIGQKSVFSAYDALLTARTLSRIRSELQ